MITVTEYPDVRVLGERIRRGDGQAFRELFEALYSSLVHYAAGICRSRHSAEDLVQDAFVRIWRNRAGLDSERSVRSLLYTTVRNLALNAVRRKSIHDQHLKRMESNDKIPADEGSHDASVLRDRLRKWIDDLPDREQEAFRLSRFADLTHREIAEVMGISRGTVEKHITNALRKLRDRLNAFDPEILRS